MIHKSIILSAVLTLVATPALAGSHEDVRIPENRVIYEVFVRNFSQAGNLKGVEAQIPRLKELGVDVVWLMPIYTPGEEGKWGTYASPYAVKDYKGIDPFYGTKDDLRSLVSTIHDNGMEIWLDWVANHTAKDHPWATTHKEYYGGNPYSPNGWNDVYQLDYSCSGLRTAMIDALKYWVSEFDIDGYRCDYADGVPRDFWCEARRQVNAVKEIAWLAESGGDGDNAKLVKETFDYNYAWGYADRLIYDVKESDSSVSVISEQSYKLHYPDTNADCYEGKSRMVYISNHDVVQDKGGMPANLFGSNVKPLTVLMFTVYGMPLIYNGQEVNYSTTGASLAEKNTIDWNGDSSVTELIKSLARLKHTQPALRTGSQSGTLINHTADNSHVYVFERRLGDESVVVMLNFSASAQTFNITSGVAAASYTDHFTGNVYDFSASKRVTLPAKGYAVLTLDENTELPPVESNENTVIFRRIQAWGNTPHVHIYYHDDTLNKDIDIMTDQQMEATSDASVFTKKVRNLRDGYYVMFNNGGWSNGQSPNSFYEATAGDYAYTLDSGWNVVRDYSAVTTKVDTLETADWAETRYYTLDGREVSRPDTGIYLCRSGSETTKRVFR